MGKRSISVLNWRNRTKQKLVEYKGGKCQKCGYDKPIWNVYDFHHRDPNEKDFGISAKSWSFERLKEEVDKCDLLCRNCHSEVHWELDNEKRQERLLLNRVYLEDKFCEHCGKEFNPCNATRKYCSVRCTKMSQRKVERPPLKQLLKEIETSNFVQVGKKYGVCDNTIRQWIRTAT